MRTRLSLSLIAVSALIVLAGVPVLDVPFLSAQEPDGAREIQIPGTELAFRMVRLAGGAFTIGSPDAAGDDDERPSREVVLSPFWMGVHEVTHDEYEIFRFRGLDDHVGAETIEFDADGVSRPTPRAL